MSDRFPRRPVGMVAFFTIASYAALAGQSVTVNATGDLLRVRAPGFGIIKGDVLNRLKNGQTVRYEIELTVLAKPGAQAAAQARQGFVLSYDLWEERFAVAQAGTASRSISHLTSPDAETWCLEQLTVPVSDLARLGRDAPFWIRLEYRIQDGNSPPTANDSAGYTLRGLIDMLSRRRGAGESRDAIEAGPFRLSR